MSLDKMHRFLTKLIDLARRAYDPRKSKLSTMASHITLRHQISNLFQCNSDVDFGTRELYAHVLAIKSLAHVIELAVRPSSTFKFAEVAWPGADFGNVEMWALQNEVWKKVDAWVWDRQELAIYDLDIVKMKAEEVVVETTMKIVREFRNKKQSDSGYSSDE
jgi:hypothetical protein